MPFFPEVHKELTRSWTAPFSAQNRLGSSSSLTTLDGGAAKGYEAIPPVERSVAMQLRPVTATSWKGILVSPDVTPRPLQVLPSQLVSASAPEAGRSGME